MFLRVSVQSQGDVALALAGRFSPLAEERLLLWNVCPASTACHFRGGFEALPDLTWILTFVAAHSLQIDQASIEPLSSASQATLHGDRILADWNSLGFQPRQVARVA